MNRITLLMVCICISIVLNAQVSKTGYITTGTLSSSLTAGELATVTNLTITGTIDARDFKTMRDNMPVPSEIDISGAAVAAYSGTVGIYPLNWGSYNYPANAVPGFAFTIPCLMACQLKTSGKFNQKQT